MIVNIAFLLFTMDGGLVTTTNISSSYRERQQAERKVVLSNWSACTFVKPIEVKSKLVKRIEGYANLNNPEFDESPNTVAVSLAKEILTIFNDFDFTPKVNPSDGGITFEFVKDNKYYLLEAFNSGDIFFLERKGKNDSIQKNTLAEVKTKIEYIFDRELQVL